MCGLWRAQGLVVRQEIRRAIEKVVETMKEEMRELCVRYELLIHDMTGNWQPLQSVNLA